LNGAFVFAADLLRDVTIPCEVSFIRLASYEGTSSTGEVKQLIGLNEDIEGRTVVIVEDIIDSGLTMQELLLMLTKKNPKEIRIASLFVKPNNLKVDLNIHYRCFDIENDFIVGYGLDYDQQGRNLPDIYKVIE
jgi:hypoxanthine phosphoribosyltransferase